MALAVAIWFMPRPRRSHRTGVASLRHLRCDDRLSGRRCVSDPHGLRLRRGGSGAHRYRCHPAKAYSGFANGTILLIVARVPGGARGRHVRSGRSASAMPSCSVFGRSTLGLSYSVFLVDGVIAPAFPSNTARVRRPVPAGFFAGRGGRRQARRSVARAGSAAS